MIRRRRAGLVLSEHREVRVEGFTLLEVLVAILIIAVVAMVLLYRRIDIVRDAAKIRDERVGWTLAALKMGELSMNPADIRPSDSGDFSLDLPDQGEYRWTYEAIREPVPLDEPEGEAAHEVLRVTLKILDPENTELQTLEAIFPAPAQATPPGEAAPVESP
ncbi:MAG TPA: type II secretion system protein [Planctomycetota bacterium]|nr:type II secretion system protein [Planctomycetota bacterium]